MTFDDGSFTSWAIQNTQGESSLFFAPPRLRHQAVVVWIGMACAHGEHEATLKILLRPIWNCSCCFMMFYLGWVLVEYELLK